MSDASSEPNKAIDRERLFAECREIATASDVLDVVAGKLPLCGLAGDTRYVLPTYLALMSRFFDRPVSVVFKGESSAGKSKQVETALSLVPQSAYVTLTASSEKAIVYMDDDLKHRFLIFQEVSGMPSGDGMKMLRSLLTEGRIDYRTTVQSASSGQFQGQQIVKEGPTGLIATTTRANLYFEDETRFLSLEVDDSTDQIKQVLYAIAANNDGSDERLAFLREMHAFHDWIATGDHAVEVPFGTELAEMIKPVSHRIKRDFRHLLSLIKASALLHQRNRVRNPETGAFIATWDDYRAVYTLVHDLMAQASQAAIDSRVRETVEAVKSLNRPIDLTDEQRIYDLTREEFVRSLGVQVKEVAKVLGLSDGSASRRLQKAAEAGFVENREPSQGRPARYKVVRELPEDEGVIPTPEALAERIQQRKPSAA